jgi:hypothetical protein
VQRPASRRASRRNASPYGSEPYEPGPYQANGPYEPGPYRADGPYQANGPYEPEGPYRPGAGPYRPQQNGPQQTRPQPYGPPPRGPQAPHGPQPPYNPQAPQAAYYGPQAAYHGPQAPYEPDTDPRLSGDSDLDFEGPGGSARTTRHRRRRGRGRIRRFFRRRTVRVIVALIAVVCCWAAFSVGQALAAPGGGSISSKLAEWARDHYLGPVVTFGEWLTYQPPKVGGTPGFSLAAPGGAQAGKKYKKVHGFTPIIPARLSSPAGHPLQGEGTWRVLETVKGEPAIFSTLLRPDKVHTSYVAGIVSLDQRLVSFQLHPGSEDPGPGNWKAQTWIPPGSRTGLLATFNGGFKLNSAGGGFYLNGSYHGSLVNGAATVVYYRNGTIKIGQWGRDLHMTPNVVGVRQNLKLIVDHGQIPANVNQDVLGSWGATLGGGYYVWRSGIGITKDGRVIFVYGPGLIVQTLADLLKRAGAVEALQLDINPEWMSFDYYKAEGPPVDPVPNALLPTQQGSAYRYYNIFSRDFTAVYAR